MSLNAAVSLNVSAQGTDKISLPHEYNSRFCAQNYLIKQPFFQILKEGYEIASEDGKETYEAERPRRHFRSFLSRIAGFFALFSTYVFAVVMSMFLFAPRLESVVVFVMIVFGSFLPSIAAYVLVAKALAPKRHLTLREKMLVPVGQSAPPLLTVSPTSGLFLFNSVYRIHDSKGAHLATFKKNYLESVFRTKWHAYGPNGAYLFTAIEDSLIMALLRRFFVLGWYIPLQFKFEKRGAKSFGNFVRRYSALDKYDLNFNPAAADGWLMVATALLLDTGENR
jgi:hypothetical protein